MKMPSMFRFVLQSLITTTAAAFVASFAQAIPMPTTPAPNLLPGFKVEWIQVAEAPHSTTDAINILNGTGGFTVLGTHEQYLTYIDLQDVDVPFAGGDPLFAIRVSGYISLGTDSSYSFLSFHDDGLLVRVGGETVIDFPVDTANVGTDSIFYNLTAGVYAYEAIGWEQGGAFNMALGIDVDGPNNDTGRFFLGGNHVPEPGTIPLLGLGAASLLALRRKAV